MSATERLRELLDERGVEWKSGYTEVSRNIRTDFCSDAGVLVSVWENDGKLGIDAHTLYRFTPEQAIAATLGGDNSDTVKHLMKLQGGHYSWPMLYEAVTGDPFDYDCPPSKSEEVFIEKLISIVGGRKVVDA